MKSLYNSNTGRVARPRKTSRPIGQPSRELARELSKMPLLERKQFMLASSMALLTLGINLIK